ncbi:tape measure protein [Xenorhabdus bovienii]|uniref:tape measure protein n=1 Tax=Xenorhabdus bovienii TaxID=40576 RepID=UPI0023B210DF|nr:tape measure protein [Xenorhabdus bovienii]MDE9589168.1 tape measure protein [Xenorhabdus bovienii]
MAKLRELIIKISANSASFQSEIARASRLGADYYRTMEKGGRQAASASRNSQQAMRELNGQLASVRDTAKGMAGAFAGMFATGRLISMADGYNALNARIKLATTSTEDFKNAQQGLLRISQYTGSTFESNASLFTRVSASLREYGYSTKDILSLTDSLATGLQVSGASAEETSSLIVQLSQALGRGVLRGQDFNSVAQSGQRIMKALSDGLGVAQKDLKQLADAGELTTPKIVPALIGQLKTLHKEFDTMPNSVSAASNRVMNAFQQWIGGANQTTGATTTLSGALDGVAKNIDAVATVAGVLVAVGAARFFGGMISGAITATGSIWNAYKGEVALAQAQVRGTQISTARARAAVYRAQRAVLAAKDIEAQIVAERRLAAAQTGLSANLGARDAARNRLNGVASLGLRMGRGLLGAVGGIPGIILGIGAAWLYVHEKNEQARKTAIAYADGVEQVREQLTKMSKVGLESTVVDASNSIAAQRKEIANTEGEIRKIRDSLKALRDMEAKSKESPLLTRLNTFYTLKEIQDKLVDVQGELSQKTYKLEQQTEKLRNTESLRSDALQKSITKTVELAGAVGSLSAMYEQLNRVTGLNTNATPPVFPGMELPALDSKQQDAIDKVRREEVLAGLQGMDKIHQQATYEADDLKLPPGWRENYIAAKTGAAIATNDLAEANRTQKQAEQEAAAAARKAASITADYQQKIANLNREIQIEIARYKEGDAAADLFASSLESGTKWSGQQRAELIRLNKTLAEAKQKYQDLQDAISNDPFRNTAESAKKAREQLERQFKNKDVTPEEYGRRKDDIWRDEVRGNASARQQYAVSAREDLRGEVDPIQDLDNQLARKKALYDTYAETQIISEQRKNELIIAADNETNERRYEAAMQLYASQGRIQKMTVDLFSVTKERMTNMLTGMLTGTQSFKEGMIGLFSSLTQSIIQNLMDMAAEAILTSNTLKAIMGVAGGLFGGAGGGGTTLANGQAVPMLPQNISVNAKGGVYDSPSLSAYSGQVVSTPTFFAFAKGAGLMGEAGPEAIMPLTRAADGSLGVRALMPAGVSAGTAPQVSIVISDKGVDSTSSPRWEQFGSEIGRFVDQRYRELIGRDLGQGGILSNAIKGGR